MIHGKRAGRVVLVWSFCVRTRSRNSETQLACCLAGGLLLVIINLSSYTPHLFPSSPFCLRICHQSSARARIDNSLACQHSRHRLCPVSMLAPCHIFSVAQAGPAQITSLSGVCFIHRPVTATSSIFAVRETIATVKSSWVWTTPEAFRYAPKPHAVMVASTFPAISCFRICRIHAACFYFDSAIFTKHGRGVRVLEGRVGCRR
mmetsp:Transcript_51228/g.120375  ORF Transcript_51228/g.120375 Transcript_51228/m.120375 type:complete len:204 (+) Transcript_51228:275-886(+)